MKKYIILFFVFILCHSLPALSEDLPAWIILEQGKLAMFNKEYGTALDLIKKAIVKKNDYPEAELLLGDIYTLEGEYEIAKRQYLKAYNGRAFFELESDKYIALYKLADIYKQQEEYKDYEDTLLKLLGENFDYTTTVLNALKEKFPELYGKEGLDRLLMLYRITENFAANAHSELAWFYYRCGRFDPAVIHSLFALTILFTETINAQKRLYPDYKFISVETLLEDILSKVNLVPEKNIVAATMGENNLKTWLLAEGVFEKLYYLACATYGAGARELAKKTWTLISRNKYSNTWGTLSQRQLQNPWVEEFLEIK